MREYIYMASPLHGQDFQRRRFSIAKCISKCNGNGKSSLKAWSIYGRSIPETNSYICRCVVATMHLQMQWKWKIVAKILVCIRTVRTKDKLIYMQVCCRVGVCIKRGKQTCETTTSCSSIVCAIACRCLSNSLTGASNSYSFPY